MYGKQYLILFLFLILGLDASAQVSGVNYHLRYNSTTCLYEACLIITEGTAITALQRLQSSAQFSLVVPTGSSVIIDKFYHPIQNNQNRTGTIPATWELANSIINPTPLAGSDIYGITPALSPSAFYNNLYPGDTIRLFGLLISPIVDCGAGIRLFDNVTDPSSSAPGMNGGDFSQGMSIGVPDLIYQNNSPSILPSKPTITSLTTSCANGLSINLSAAANSCQSPLFYTWGGPDGYVGTTKDVHLSNPVFYNNGVYAVTVSDNLGCTQSASIQAYGKPNAGADQSVSCFSTSTATLNAVGTGTWSLGSNSVGTAIISNPSNPISTVNGFSTAGNYFLIWSDNNCADTTIITAGNNCSCNVINTLSLPNINTYCGVSPSILLDGNTVTGATGTYQWIVKINNGSFVNAPSVATNEDYQTVGLTPGVYTFRRIFNKTSAPTCVDTSNHIVITIVPISNAGDDKTVHCLEDGTTSLTSTTQGVWSLGDGSAGTVSFSSLSGLTTTLTGFTTEGIYYIIRTSSTCTDTAVVTVDNLCGCGYADAGVDANKCAGDNVPLYGHCSVGLWTAAVTNPSGATLSPTVNGNSQVSFSDQASGIFRFVYTTLDDHNDTVAYTVYPKPVVTLGEDIGFCEGGESVLITANGGVTYLWSTGQTTSSILIQPMTSTSYSVSGTDGNGCSNADVMNVTIFPKPQGQIPYIPPVFENDNLDLMAGSWSHASLYTWQGPNGYVSNSPNNNLTNVTTEAAGMYYLTVTSPDDCSNIDAVMVTVMERALPVKFGLFLGTYRRDLYANELIWHTHTEINNDYFIVERSDDNGRSFRKVANIKGAGNATDINEYYYLDSDIVLGKTYYYRLVQVDYDDKNSLSDIIVIRSEKDDRVNVAIYPNPTQDKLYIRTDMEVDGDVEIKIYNSNGSLVYSNSLTAVENEIIPVDGFDGMAYKQGVYIVRVNVGGMVSQHKLMIVR